MKKVEERNPTERFVRTSQYLHIHLSHKILYHAASRSSLKVKCVIFWFMYTLGTNQFRVISISVSLNFHHLFTRSTFSFLSPYSFETRNALLLITFSLFSHRTPGLSPLVKQKHCALDELLLPYLFPTCKYLPCCKKTKIRVGFLYLLFFRYL